MMSPRLAKLAVTPPVVGWVSTLMYNPPFAENRWMAALVLAICIRLKMPSCIRAPPLAEKNDQRQVLGGGVLDGAGDLFAHGSAHAAHEKAAVQHGSHAGHPADAAGGRDSGFAQAGLVLGGGKLFTVAGKCSTSCGARSASSSRKLPWSSTRLSR